MDSDDLKEFLRRGMAAQKAVNEITTKIDAVGTAGGKVTIETKEPNSWRKIRLKSAPKDYKKGPGPTGKDRLQRSLNSLLQRASRFSRKEDITEKDRAWAQKLTAALIAINVNEFVNNDEPFDITTIIGKQA